VYLDGQIDKQYPGLEISTLKLSGGCPKYGEIEKRIVDISNPVTRHISSDNEGYEYGGPLTLSYNEILFDTFWPWWGYEPVKKNCWLEATARLPDSRILFSIAMNFTAQWPPGGPS
jgi:hypothetical protein